MPETKPNPVSAIATIALGGNQGDVPATMTHALSFLDALPEVRILRKSRLFRTVPIGTDAGGSYANAAAVAETSLPPETFLDLLQQIEHECGRVRTVHWGPRTLDLDLIRYDDLVLNTDRLALPHPACWYRRFVLDPWYDVDPEWVHPVMGESVRRMRERLLLRPLPVAVVGGDETFRATVNARLRERFSPEQVSVSPTGLSPILTLSLDAVPIGSPRTISLAAADDPSALAVQVLMAALDEPAVQVWYPSGVVS